MGRWIVGSAALVFGATSPVQAAQAQAASPSAAVANSAVANSAAAKLAVPSSYQALATLFKEWRQFAMPQTKGGRGDYSAAAVARWSAGLPGFRQRLQAIDRMGWPLAAQNDFRIVEAEMNGMDFDLRVLQPWARDPTFYANVFADRSDVPAHEGPYAHPHIDLHAFAYPLSKADEQTVTTLLAAVPANLAAAKDILKNSNARDFWTYGGRAFKEQSATLAAYGEGRLKVNRLDGRSLAPIEGTGPEFRRAIAEAKAATDDFAAWIAAEAPKKTGPSGVGKENYNWYIKNVELIPYDWDAQVVLLQRELDRSLASLRLEEVRNRKLPPATTIEDPAAFRAMTAAKAATFSQFLADTGLIPDAPWSRAAIAAQKIDHVPLADRNFFSHVNAYDPLPLISHFTHWIDLARLDQEPHASPIRQVPPLFNIYAGRSEGFATAFEEIAMHAGLYDDSPRGRELVWIMLANRAARGLASLHVQANSMTLDEAGKFHAEWTPRGWSDPASPLVGFEQLLYARQPGYGPSYVIGKVQLDRLLGDVSHAREVAGRPFVMRDVMQQVMAAGIIPIALLEDEMLNQ